MFRLYGIKPLPQQFREVLPVAMDVQPLAQNLSPIQWVISSFNFFYVLVQHIIVWLFKPVRPHSKSLRFLFYLFSLLQPPPPSPELPQQVNGRIAVIGAGLTGVSSAAHAIAHGFDVVIYEQTDEVGA